MKATLTTPARAESTPQAEHDLVLSFSAVRMTYGQRVALNNVTFQVRAGEAYGLLGPNGAGKSTAIRLVCGIAVPDVGTVTVDGGPVVGHRASATRASLGYVPQGLALFPSLTLAENLRFWARMYGIPRRHRRERIAEVLTLVGLAGRPEDRLEQCSGGTQRRLNLAVALLHHPKLLVLDEPTVGVDPQSRASLLEQLGRLRDNGTAILYTSHYLDEVQRLCDRIGVVDRGRLLVEGHPDRLVDQHADVPDLQALFLELTGRDLRD